MHSLGLAKFIQSSITVSACNLSRYLYMCLDVVLTNYFINLMPLLFIFYLWNTWEINILEMHVELKKWNFSWLINSLLIIGLITYYFDNQLMRLCNSFFVFYSLTLTSSMLLYSGIFPSLGQLIECLLVVDKTLTSQLIIVYSVVAMKIIFSYLQPLCTA